MNVVEIHAGNTSTLLSATTGAGAGQLTPALTVGILIDVTGTTVKIQVSADNSTWVDHPDFTTGKTIDSAFTVVCPFKYIRAAITAGTGATTVTMSW